MTDDEQIAQFEKLGIDQVEAIAMGWQQPLRGFAFEWLKTKRAEREKHMHAIEAEQRRIGTLTLRAAIVAAVAAVIGTIVSTVAWLLPIH